MVGPSGFDATQPQAAPLWELLSQQTTHERLVDHKLIGVHLRRHATSIPATTTHAANTRHVAGVDSAATHFSFGHDLGAEH